MSGVPPAQRLRLARRVEQPLRLRRRHGAVALPVHHEQRAAIEQLRSAGEALDLRRLMRLARCGIGPIDAYLLCSVGCDLKVSEIVDAPNWIVTAYCPLSIFG